MDNREDDFVPMVEIVDKETGEVIWPESDRNRIRRERIEAEMEQHEGATHD